MFDVATLDKVVAQVVFVDDWLTTLEELKNEIPLGVFSGTAILVLFASRIVEKFILREMFELAVVKEVDGNEVSCFATVGIVEVVMKLADSWEVRDGGERLLVKSVDGMLFVDSTVLDLSLDLTELCKLLADAIFVNNKLAMLEELENELLLDVVFGTAIFAAFETLPVEKLTLLEIVEVVAVKELDDSTFKLFKDVKKVTGFVKLDVLEVTVKLVDKLLFVIATILEIMLDVVALDTVVNQVVFVDDWLPKFEERENEMPLEVFLRTAMLVLFASLIAEELILREIFVVVAVEDVEVY
ncbi:hypothetical protein HK100_010802 [Physocladia obscura]|uniref:Uncharacterized protein n=1 Tax=Physocladia obscura TaxID=109957 RepID=A0AAD5T9L6_9FUNG|nr:hypothetical protein HK100_010802 [Physocladia obscura]